MGITLQNITKTYDKAKQPVLNDVNAEISRRRVIRDCWAIRLW